MSATYVAIDPSQFPDAIRRELVRSLRRREINHKFHYDTYKQANKWLALHEAHSPAHSDPACLGIYNNAFTAVAHQTAITVGQGCRSTDPGVPRIQVIGLGCGGGAKEERLLRLLRSQGFRSLSYVPSDVSMPLVLVARNRVERLVDPKNIQPLVCDLALAKTADLESLIPRLPGVRRIVTFFGMIPNFEPRIILPKLAALVHPGDALLFSANLVPELTASAMNAVLPQYDNELTRDWLMTFLSDLGVEPNDGEVKFSTEFVRGRVSLARFVAHYRFHRSRIVRLGADEFVFKRGDALRLFFSYRYTAETVVRVLAPHSLVVADSWITPEEGVFLCLRK